MLTIVQQRKHQMQAALPEGKVVDRGGIYSMLIKCVPTKAEGIDGLKIILYETRGGLGGERGGGVGGATEGAPRFRA